MQTFTSDDQIKEQEEEVVLSNTNSMSEQDAQDQVIIDDNHTEGTQEDDLEGFVLVNNVGNSIKEAQEDDLESSTQEIKEDSSDDFILIEEAQKDSLESFTSVINVENSIKEAQEDDLESSTQEIKEDSSDDFILIKEAQKNDLESFASVINVENSIKEAQKDSLKDFTSAKDIDKDFADINNTNNSKLNAEVKINNLSKITFKDENLDKIKKLNNTKSYIFDSYISSVIKDFHTNAQKDFKATEINSDNTGDNYKKSINKLTKSNILSDSKRQLINQDRELRKLQSLLMSSYKLLDLKIDAIVAKQEQENQIQLQGQENQGKNQKQENQTQLQKQENLDYAKDEPQNISQFNKIEPQDLTKDQNVLKILEDLFRSAFGLGKNLSTPAKNHAAEYMAIKINPDDIEFYNSLFTPEDAILLVSNAVQNTASNVKKYSSNFSILSEKSNFNQEKIINAKNESIKSDYATQSNFNQSQQSVNDLSQISNSPNITQFNINEEKKLTDSINQDFVLAKKLTESQMNTEYQMNNLLEQLNAIEIYKKPQELKTSLVDSSSKSSSQISSAASKISSIKPEPAPIKPEAVLVKPETTSIKLEVNLDDIKVDLANSQISSAASKISSIKPETTLIKPEAASIKPETTLVKPEVSLENHIENFKSNAGTAKINLDITNSKKDIASPNKIEDSNNIANSNNIEVINDMKSNNFTINLKLIKQRNNQNISNANNQKIDNLVSSAFKNSSNSQINYKDNLSNLNYNLKSENENLKSVNDNLKSVNDNLKSVNDNNFIALNDNNFIALNDNTINKDINLALNAMQNLNLTSVISQNTSNLMSQNTSNLMSQNANNANNLDKQNIILDTKINNKINETSMQDNNLTYLDNIKLSNYNNTEQLNNTVYNKHIANYQENQIKINEKTNENNTNQNLISNITVLISSNVHNFNSYLIMKKYNQVLQHYNPRVISITPIKINIPYIIDNTSNLYNLLFNLDLNKNNVKNNKITNNANKFTNKVKNYLQKIKNFFIN